MAAAPQDPIDLFYWPTPNGWKISIMLEECGLPYEVRAVNIGKGDQFKPDFLAISPNNKMPAIVDPKGRTASRSRSSNPARSCNISAARRASSIRWTSAGASKCDQWLFWQMGGFGPMLGQTHHFRIYAPEKIPYAIERYTNEANRLYGVLEQAPRRTGNSSPASTPSPTWRSPAGRSSGSGRADHRDSLLQIAGSNVLFPACGPTRACGQCGRPRLERHARSGRPRGPVRATGALGGSARPEAASALTSLGHWIQYPIHGYSRHQGNRRTGRRAASDGDAVRRRRAAGGHRHGRTRGGASAPPEEIADALGVSRTPVREWLRLLEAEGWVEFSPHRGAVVATLSRDEVRQILESVSSSKPSPSSNRSRDSRTPPSTAAPRSSTNSTPRRTSADGSPSTDASTSACMPPGRRVSLIESQYDAVDRYLRLELVEMDNARDSQVEHRAILSACRDRTSGGGGPVRAAHRRRRHRPRRGPRTPPQKEK